MATLEDFGTQGEKPSHPELLDHLATELVQQKWSLKALHRLIVTSATYRQSSKARPDLAERDPVNVLLARQSRMRLEAEQLRDNALAASGLLTRTIGGPSVRPPQPAGISELTYAGSAKWVESTGADRYRRGLYIWFQRTSPYPMLMTFDAPDSNLCCVRRERQTYRCIAADADERHLCSSNALRALGSRLLGGEGATPAIDPASWDVSRLLFAASRSPTRVGAPGRGFRTTTCSLAVQGKARGRRQSWWARLGRQGTTDVAAATWVALPRGR